MIFRRPRKRRRYTLEERIAKFENNAYPCKAPEKTIEEARRRGLTKRSVLPDTSPCSRLLDFILENLTKGQDGGWYFLGAVRLAADLTQMDQKQARRCVHRFIENGLLEKYGRNSKGRPQQYRVHLKTD